MLERGAPAAGVAATAAVAAALRRFSSLGATTKVAADAAGGADLAAASAEPGVTGGGFGLAVSGTSAFRPFK
jgi:hypothetical protein